MTRRTTLIVAGLLVVAVMCCITSLAALWGANFLTLVAQNRLPDCANNICVYTNQRLTFRVSTPAGWEARPNIGGPGDVLYLLEPGTRNAVTIEMYEKGYSDESLDNYVAEFVRAAQKDNPYNRRDMTTTKTTMSGRLAWQHDYTWTGERVDYRTRAILMEHRNQILTFWLTAEPKDFDRLLPQYERMTSSFIDLTPARR